MATVTTVLLRLFLLLALPTSSLCLPAPVFLPSADELFPNGTGVSRADFPDGFIFGSITSALKHEGAALVDGKSLNIWDQYAQVHQGATRDNSIPNECGNSYYSYKEDHALLVDLGMDAYRLSLAWSRIYPNGSGQVNELAIAHYNKVIDDALANGLTLFVTLWTQDHPYQLEEYGGLLSAKFVEDFANYANVCFSAFGDRIKLWITLDEPNDYAALGYATDQTPPGRCTSGIIGYGDCDEGNSATEPYIAGHNLLLAHAAAVEIYRSTYQVAQNGSIGIALWTRWYEPLNETEADSAAADRAIEFVFGWFLHPLLIGDYPPTMKSLVGSRLPSFSDDELSSLLGSIDFLGVNIITAFYTYDHDYYAFGGNVSYYNDWRAATTGEKDGIAIGVGNSDYAVPWCIGKTVDYVKNKYNNFPMYITQTGWGINYSTMSETLEDDSRVSYFETYYDELAHAIRYGANVKGVFAWSLLDGFEFNLGLQIRVGIYYVDDEFRRYPRKSALWHKAMLANTTSTTKSSLVLST